MYCDLGLYDLATLYRRREVSPVEVVKAHLQRCEQLNPILNAYLLILYDSGIQAAKAAEGLFRAGIDLGPLQGVPISVKDLIRVRHTRTTAGSRILIDEPPDQSDAVIVHRLRSAGAVIIGKTNLHEFASGDPDPTGPFGLVQNPRRIGHHPGSSSSGAGAATAAGMGVIAIGTDTGGSSRIPACLCGVVGIKPTTGRIPTDGVIPLSRTLDTIGLLARSVVDIALTLKVCANQGVNSIGSTDQARICPLDQLDQNVQGWRVGVLRGKFFEKTQPPVTTAFEETLQLLRELGCQLMDVEPTGMETMVDLVTLIIQAEGSTYHERYRGNEYLYGSGFRDRVLKGREIKALTYLKCRQEQFELQQKWLTLVRKFDVLVMPSGPAVAPRHNESTIEVGDEYLPFRDLLGRFTRPFNLLGWPALSVPNGLTLEGLPTGIQIAGPPDSEANLLILGYQIEKGLGLTGKLGIEPCYPK